MIQPLFTKHPIWFYGLSAALLLGAVVIYIHGGHDDIGQWMAIAAIGLALVVANANGQLTHRKKPKD
jgi:hypothetical protein